MNELIEKLQVQSAFLQNEKALNESQKVVLNEKLKKAFLQENTNGLDFFNQQYSVRHIISRLEKIEALLEYFKIRISDCENELEYLYNLN